MKMFSLAVSFCLLLCGCVTGSLNPFYTDDLLVAKPELFGTWYFDESIEANDESPLTLSEGKLTIYDDKGVASDTKAVFFQVDEALFIDIFPDEGKLKQELVGEEPPVHLVSRVQVLGADKISFNALDYDWLAKQIDEGKILIPHKKADESADILFTASSAEWVNFLRQYKNDERAFPKEAEAILVRKEQKK